MRMVSVLVILVALISGAWLSVVTSEKTGSIRGAVFTADHDGGYSVIPDATITLQGTAKRET
jgi:hypothetical protein